MKNRILLEALITEREGMIAENSQREYFGESIAYGYKQFFTLAEEMKALVEDIPEKEVLDEQV